MEHKQVADFVNTAAKEALGLENLVDENLSNCVDAGKTLTDMFNANSNLVDPFTKNLINRIGNTILVNRPYEGRAPSLIVDRARYGSITMKIMTEPPEAVDNAAWQLVDGRSYDDKIFRQPVVDSKFFNQRETFRVDRSIAIKQMEESFLGPDMLNAFVSSLDTATKTAITIREDELAMRTVNNMIAETIYSEYPTAAYAASSGVRAINLLKLYNDANGTTLTPAAAVQDPAFIRFASYKMRTVADRLAVASTLYNIGGKIRYTPKDRLKAILHADFRAAAEVYLYNGSGQFKDEFLRLPEADTTPYWQGSGTSYAFADTSKIDVTSTGNHAVEVGGILGVMFDRDALGLSNLEQHVETELVKSARFINYFHFWDCGHWTDANENFVVFFVA